MSIGRAGDGDSPKIKDMEHRVIEAGLDAGIPPRAEIETANQAKYYLDMGVRHFWIGTDVTVLFDWGRYSVQPTGSSLSHRAFRAWSPVI